MPLSVLAIPAALAFCLAGCRETSQHSRVADIMASDSLPNSVKNVVKAIADNDSTKFASLVSYPLRRPYPLHNIDNDSQMRRYYSVMVDDSLHNIVVDSPPQLWSCFGWRGWSLDDGRYLWVDDKIYDVAYLSSREKSIRDSLVIADMASLPAQLRDGYTPVACLAAAGSAAVYRIDAATSEKVAMDRAFRLSVYPQGAMRAGLPDEIFFGSMSTEGTAATISYTFTMPGGGDIIYDADISDDSSPCLLMQFPDGRDSIVQVRPSYWLDMLPRR